MTNPSPPSEEDEKAARAACEEILKADPNATYRDVRREARLKGAKVTRRVFSAVAQELFPDRRQQRDGDERWPPEGPALDHGRERNPQAPERRRPDTFSDGFDRRSPNDRRESGPPRTPFTNPHVHPRRPTGGPPDGRDPRAGTQDGEARGRWNDLWKQDSPAGSDSPLGRPEDILAGRGPGSGPGHSAHTPSPIRVNAVEFMAGHLRDHPEASYKEVRELAEDSGYTVSAAAFGRAQVIAGILKRDEEVHRSQSVISEPAQTKPQDTPAVSQSSPAKARSTEEDPVVYLQKFISHFGDAVDRRGELRSALQEMLKVVQQALGRTPEGS